MSRMPRALGSLILLGAAAWSGYAAFADAPVVDEAPHLAAGVSYVADQEYRLNPEHPPLTKAAAGALALLAQPVLPLDAAWWADGINEQWRAGAALLWDGRNDPAAVLGLGRLGVVLLCFLLLTVGWRLIARRWGEWHALAFLALAASSPFFLGHAHLITTDVAAAGAALLASGAFAWFLAAPDAKRGAVAALLFGVAQLAKFSLLLLVPAFLLAALAVAWSAHGWKARKLLAGLLPALAVCAAGFAFVVYPAYLALTWHGAPEVSRRDAAFLLSSFAGGPDQGLIRQPARYAADAAIALSGRKLTQPAGTYLLGVLMVAQRSAGGNTAYFAGDVGSSGSKLYFPAVYLAKETLPALAAIGIGLLLGARALRGRWRRALGQPSLELVLGAFAVLYLASTFRSSLNIGVRHLFPVIPALYLLALSGWRARKGQRWALALGGLVTLHVATGFLALPYPLAYHNPLAGGTAYGWRVSADSNYDWGQDALRLREWMDAHPEAGKVAVHLFGGSDAQALLGDRAVAWWPARGNPAAYGIRWMAVSSSYLLTASARLVPQEPRRAIDEYRWLQELRGTPAWEVPEPDARAGTAIFLYRLY